ncbi:hypothetical protein A3715_17335 [Oleiphilus sp. HI0009]|nr:hypothetical protein A3715_17335 [Oleiphilus sp. HI0009]
MSILEISKFTVRIVRKDDLYGLNFCLKHTEDEAFIEFYDKRFKEDNRGPDARIGQFISRYYLGTLLDECNGSGLCLAGGVKEWNVDKADISLILKWAKRETTEAEQTVRPALVF